MGLPHKEASPVWKYINRASARLPTNATSWTNFLKDLYNDGELEKPVACPQRAQGACKIDENTIAGAIKKLAKGKVPEPDGVRSENIPNEQTLLL